MALMNASGSPRAAVPQANINATANAKAIRTATPCPKGSTGVWKQVPSEFKRLPDHRTVFSTDKVNRR
jgi:hypothetical protein